MNNDPTLTSSHDDLAAAFAKASEATPATPAAPVAPAAPAQAPETPAPVQRGPDGRFASSGTAETPAPTPLGTPAAPTTPAATTPAAVVAPTPAQATTPAAGETAVVFDPAKPPSGWKAEAKAKWESIPEDLRQEITRREEASYQGVQRLRKQMEPMETLYKAVAPHAQYFAHIQSTPQDYFQNVLAIEQTLTLGNPAQKMQTLLDLADQYSIPLRQVLDSAMGGKLNDIMQQSHAQHKTPPPMDPAVAKRLREAEEFRERVESQAVEQELATFEASNPPFYDKVRDKMADLLEKGIVETYQDAYDLAVWQDPALRSQSVAQANGLAQQTGIQARQAAAAAVATPAAAALNVPAKGSENESTEDTVRRAWAAATGTAGSV